MAASIASFFPTISREDLAKSAARSAKVLPATLPQQKKRPVGHPRKTSEKDYLHNDPRERPRKRSVTDSGEGDNSVMMESFKF